MLPKAHRFRPGIREFQAAILGLALVGSGGAALAGSSGGTLQQTGTLELRLDNTTPESRFVRRNSAGSIVEQQLIAESQEKRSKCLVELPLFATDVATSTEVPPLVSNTASPTPWGIDQGKGPALGGRGGARGTGCGQIDFGEVFQIDFPSDLVGSEVRVQIEAKQQAVVRLSFWLNPSLLDGSLPDEDTLVGTRYLVTGSIAAPGNEGLWPQEVQDALAAGLVTRVCITPDCGNDSGASDDDIWVMGTSVEIESGLLRGDGVPVPLHNRERFEILESSAGTGLLSLKAGGDFAAAKIELYRSTWQTFEAEGLLDCFDSFTVSSDAGGRRLDNEGCTIIPFTAAFDGKLFSFDTRTGAQQVNLTFDVCFDPEPASTKDDPTLASFRDVNATTCDPDNGICVDADGLPTSTGACTADSECGMDEKCSFNCFPLELCLGAPMYECLDASNATVGSCVGESGATGAQCNTDSDCETGEACSFSCVTDSDCATGTTCELVDLTRLRCADGTTPCMVEGEACETGGGLCENRFPDLDLEAEGVNYACWFRKEDTLSAEAEVTVCQESFWTDDARKLRR